MHSKVLTPGIGYFALALVACRGDSMGTPPLGSAPSLLASRHAANGPPRFSAWSAPVNLGPPVNTPFIEQAASLSRDGRSLYFHCGNCPGSIGGGDTYLSPRGGGDDPPGPPPKSGPTPHHTPHHEEPRPARDRR